MKTAVNGVIFEALWHFGSDLHEKTYFFTGNTNIGGRTFLTDTMEILSATMDIISDTMDILSDTMGILSDTMDILRRIQKT